MNDGNPGTYWATDDGEPGGTIDLQWRRPVRLDRLVIQEAIALGQRVQAWTAQAEIAGRWTPLTSGTTIGYKRIATFPAVTTSKVRVTIQEGLACPAISTVSAYLAPPAVAR